MPNTRLKRAALWTGGLLLGASLFLALVLGGGLLWLRSDAGRDWLAAKIGEVTTDSDSAKVTVRGVGPGLPWRIAVDELLVADERGVWLRIENLLLRPDLSDFLRQVFRFKVVSADVVALLRQPLTGPDRPEPQPEEEGPLIPDLPDIRMEELSIGRLHLGQPLTGQDLNYSVQGRISSSQGVTTARLEAKSFERAEDALIMIGKYEQAGDTLALDLDYHESPGGLAGSLLDLPGRPKVRLSLRGEGPLRDWRGRFDVTAGDIFALDTRLALSAVEPYLLDVQGSAKASSALLPEDVADLVGNEAVFRLKARPTQTGTIEIASSGIRTQELLLGLEGAIDPGAQTLDVTASIAMPELVDMIEDAGLGVEIVEPIVARAHGPFSHPTLRVEARAEYLRGGDLSLAHPRLALTAEPPEQGLGNADTSMRLHLESSAVVMAGDVLLRSVVAEVEAASSDFKRVRIPRLTLRSRELALSGSAQANLAVPQGSADLRLAIDDLSRLADLTGMPLTGSARLDASLSLADNGLLSVSLQGRTSGLAGLPEALQTAIGPEVAARVKLVHANQEVRLDAFAIDGKLLRLTAQGGTDLADKTFGVDVTARLADVEPVAQAAGFNATGSLAASGRAKGSYADFEADIRLDSEQLTISGEPFTNVRLTASANDLPEPSRIRLDLAAGTPMGRAEAATVASYSTKRDLALLQNTRVELPGLRLASPSLAIRTESGLMDGSLTASATSLKFISALVDTPLAAQGSLDVRLDARNGRQAANMRGSFKDLRLSDVEASAFTLQADLTDLLGTPGGTAEVNLSDVRQGDMLVSSASLTARGDLEQVALTAQAQGDLVHPFQVGLEGAYSQTRSGWSATIETLRVSVAETPIVLRRPFRFVSQGQRQTLSELHLRVADGNISAQGRLEPDSVNGRLRVDSFPASLLPFLVPKPSAGGISAELILDGTPAEPRLDLDVRAQGVRIPGLDDVPALGLTAEAAYAQGGVQASVRLPGGTGMSGTLRAAFPARLSLSPVEFELPEGGRLTGSVQARLDLGALPTLLQLDAQTMDGTAMADMELSGSLAEPLLAGTIATDDGRYQNLNTGTVLAKVNLLARAEGQAIHLERLSATDGDGGRITAEGSLEFGGEITYEMLARLRNATVVRMPEATSTASGSLDLSGNAEQAALGGTLTLERTEISIPGELPDEVVELDVRRINVPEEEGGEEAEAGAGAGEPPFDFGLDVAVDIPNQLFVRGRGLEAEFKGQLAVRGSADAPEIVGTMELIRGRYAILGQTLTLTEGIIRFTGAVPPEPQILLVATARSGDVQATMRVSGTADNLNIQLSSDPPLPQDEILARLIFGQALTDLSPFQAVQLAQAVQQIRGGGGGPDVQGGFRRFLGLDELTVGEADPSVGGGYTLEAGKYITDNVYLRLDKGITAEEDKVGVVIELTPSINLESEAGSTSGMGLGLFWQRDY